MVVVASVKIERGSNRSQPLLQELSEHFSKIEEILATLEELMDKEELKRIRKSLEEYKKER